MIIMIIIQISKDLDNKNLLSMSVDPAPHASLLPTSSYPPSHAHSTFS